MMWWALLVIILLFCVTALTGAPYVPSHRRDVQRALTQLYSLGPEDCLVDSRGHEPLVWSLTHSSSYSRAGACVAMPKRWWCAVTSTARTFQLAPQWSTLLATHATSLGWPPMCSSKPPAWAQTYGSSPTPLPYPAGRQCASKARISCIGGEQNNTNSIPLLSITPGISIIGV